MDKVFSWNPLLKADMKWTFTYVSLYITKVLDFSQFLKISDD